MDLERLIELTEQGRSLPTRRVTYAQVIADCAIQKNEALDMLRRVRNPDVSAADARTLLRRLAQALPRAGLHSPSLWNQEPEKAWREAMWGERQHRIARLTRDQTADAVLRMMANPHDVWLASRLNWAFAPARVVGRWGIHDLDGDADEIADGLFRLDSLYLARLADPEMDADELTALIARINDAPDDDDWRSWRDESLRLVLDLQVPQAGLSDTLCCHKDAEAGTLVRKALAMTRPDPNIRVYRD